MACAFTQDIFEMIAMIAEVRTPCWWSDQDGIPLEGLRRRQPGTGTFTEVLCVEQAGWSVGGALLCSPDTTDRLADLRAPSGRMELISTLIVAGLGRWVR